MSKLTAFLAGCKNATHLIAVGIVAVDVFAHTNAGEALIHQYPWLTGISAAIGVLAALYRRPQKAN